ncbi:MAG: radical SAM protein [Candidatus Omnitrophica bacterium]|nr:radical SAM protein [Candidatus Omnitrophota bacterium]
MNNNNFLIRKLNSFYYPQGNYTPLPYRVMVEPTNICNLKCSMCYVQQNLKRNHSLTLVSFQNIINQFPNIRELIFCGIGEPLLNKDLFHMIDDAKNRGIIFINLITNGESLTKDISERILKSKINRIQISIHSFNPEIFSKIRKEEAVSLEKLKENIKTLIALKNEFRSSLEIYSNAVINKFNYHNLSDFIKNSRELGIDGVDFIQMTTANDNLKEINAPLKNVAQDAKDARKLARKLKIKVSFLSGNYCGRCYQLWDFIMIHADGNISPCNGIFPTENIDVGNIFNNSIEEIWNSEKYRRLRGLVVEGGLQNCQFCESGYCLEGKDLRWIKNYYFRPIKRLIKKSLLSRIRGRS